MSRQALQQRLNTAGAADFLREVFLKSLSEVVTPVFDRPSPELLTPFRRILLFESTQIKLNEELCDVFSGCGGSGGSSALKLHLVSDFHHQKIVEVSLTSATTSEIEMGERFVWDILPDDLVLCDLLKGKQRRKTTYQRIQHQETFDQCFSSDTANVLQKVV
jgi:hypothetical protein